MTDQPSSRLSEFTWYSRLAAWIGAAMLLAQSVLGRDAGPVTILAVFLLGGGFLCFLIGLAIDSRLPGTALLIGPRLSAPASHSTPSPAASLSTQLEPVGEPLTPVEQTPIAATAPPAINDLAVRKKGEKPEVSPAPASAAVARGPGRRPKFRERAKKSDVRPESPVESGPEPSSAEKRETQPMTAHVDPAPAGVATESLGPGDVEVGAECPRCESSLRLGQLSATCPVCGRTHHAVCWMENHFHCGAPDCDGHGSLEAPTTPHEARRPDIG
jgi:hypothetical protein